MQLALNSLYYKATEILLLYAKNINDNWKTLHELLKIIKNKFYWSPINKTKMNEIITNFLDQVSQEKAPSETVMLKDIKQDFDCKVNIGIT